MKLVDLLINQKLIIQLLWGEQKIEFFSSVVGKDDASVYVTPYLHNESELELNVTDGKGVICNIFTDDPSNKQRISWKNVELVTMEWNGQMAYCIKTYGFNNRSNADDRRLQERIVIDLEGKVYDGHSSEGMKVIVHDISDVGIAFYAPNSFAPNSQQLFVTFTDTLNDKKYNVRVECAISRISNETGHIRVGCKITGENKDYHLYRFMKYLAYSRK